VTSVSRYISKVVTWAITYTYLISHRTLTLVTKICTSIQSITLIFHLNSYDLRDPQVIMCLCWRLQPASLDIFFLSRYLLGSICFLFLGHVSTIANLIFCKIYELSWSFSIVLENVPHAIRIIKVVVMRKKESMSK